MRGIQLPQLYYNIIEEVVTYIYLGTTLDNKLDLKSEVGPLLENRGKR